jgi:hypothetical protein
VVRAEALSPPDPEGAQPRCSNCGAPLGENQEWCLGCGAARTLLRPPPDWRIPVAVLVGLVVLVAAGVLVVLSLLD